MLIDQLRANVEALAEDGPTPLSRLLEQAANELEDVVEILDRLDRAEADLHTLRATIPGAVPEPLWDERQLLLRAQRHGGTFMAHLATAWLFADPANAGKLRAAFGEMLARYASAPAVEEE